MESFATPLTEYIYPCLVAVLQLTDPKRLRLLRILKMYLQAFICFGAIALTATAAPTFTSHVVHEKRRLEPLNWAKYSRVDPSTVLPIRIGLTQSNLDNGPVLLDEV